MKRFIASSLAVSLALAALTGCSSGAEPTSASAVSKNAIDDSSLVGTFREPSAVHGVTHGIVLRADHTFSTEVDAKCDGSSTCPPMHVTGHWEVIERTLEKSETTVQRFVMHLGDGGTPIDAAFAYRADAAGLSLELLDLTGPDGAYTYWTPLLSGQRLYDRVSEGAYCASTADCGGMFVTADICTDGSARAIRCGGQHACVAGCASAAGYGDACGLVGSSGSVACDENLGLTCYERFMDQGTCVGQ